MSLKNKIKWLIYFLFFVFMIFIIPALCTKKTELTMTNVNNYEISENNEKNKKYDYSKYGTIKLYHTKSDTVETLPIDEYLYGVVSAEMPANYEEEALKAQAVVARTYTIYQISSSGGKHKDKGADMCDNSGCCQAWISKEDRLNKWSEDKKEEYWNKIVEAVDSTAGKIVTYNGKAIDAFFHSNSGGETETVSSVWGGKDLPYLQSVETSGESDYAQYSSEVKITKEDFIKKMKEEYDDLKIDFKKNDAIKILEYTGSGRVKTIKVGNVEIAGTKIRSLLGLKSTNFSVKIDGDNIIFSVIGYGHGVGMSQTGADSLAKQGYSYEDIIKHFYSGVEITSL